MTFPEAFLTQAGAILERYPRECIEYITAPTTGVQSRERFLTLAAIREACEAYMAPVWRRQAAQRGLVAQISDRRATPINPVVGKLLSDLASQLRGVS